MKGRRVKSSMGRFIIFIGLVLIFSAIGLTLWWIGNKTYISIQRQNSVFDIEKETHEKIRESIKGERNNEV